MIRSILMWKGVHSTLSSKQYKTACTVRKNPEQIETKSQTLSHKQCVYMYREKSRMIYSKY